MKLVDLKRSKAERKDQAPKAGLGGDDYPYGLSVHLDHDSLEKLGVKNLPKAGAKMHLQAHAHVKSVEERHEDGGKKRRHMTLELRHMALKHGNEQEHEKNANAGAKAEMDKALNAADYDEDADNDAEPG